MAPTVLLEYTRDKAAKRSCRDLSSQMMGKSQKSSRSFSSGFVLDYHHAVETVGETEDFEDSSAPKRKVLSLNANGSDGFSIPLQVIALSRMSSTEKKDLSRRLRSELDQIKSFQKMIAAKNMPVAVSSSSNSKIPQNISNLKHSATGRFESNKRAAPLPPQAHVNNSYALLMKQCVALLKRLMNHPYGWVFNDPVDVVKLNIPDYLTVIKHPMDLGTIKSRLATGTYANPWGFVADVRLTFTNAMTYNPPGNDVHLMADVLSKLLETSWKPIEKKLVAADSAAKKFLGASTPKELAPLLKKRRLSPPSNNVVVEEVIKPRVTDEEKHELSSRLESLLGDIPEHIIEFLRGHSDGSQSGEDEIEIDIGSLSDDTLVKLRRLLDEHLQEKQTKGMKAEPWEIEIINEPGLSNSSVHPFKGNELADEEVDIGGNDLPMCSYPPIEIEKDTVQKNSKCSSSSHSGSDSSSSSDSDSGSSSGSESDVGQSSPANTSKENVKPIGNHDLERSVITNPPDINNTGSVTSDHSEQGVHKKPLSVEVDGHPKGDNAPSERQVSPEKQYRAALLRSRFADTILKAREKTLDKGEKADPEKLHREREELEQQKREDRARLQAEAKAAEEARRRADAEAAAEAKRKRELEREAARQALLKMEKTVEINENSLILKDLEMLRTEHIPTSFDETSPDLSQDAMGGFKLGGSNPLEQLGLFMKVDDEEEEEAEPANVPMNDVEEGEID